MKTSLRALLIAFVSLHTFGAWAVTLYVDLASGSPMPPYTSWSTAATNIQDAIEAATDGDLVLVTNGVYAAGGKVMFGDLTNRVALDKAITVQSVNGPWFTTIRGNGATNGLNAVRCAWITNGAILQGFTLTAGATRASGDPTNLLSGGGVLCLTTNALLRNCLVISNLAQLGGGVFQGLVLNSAIIGNRSLGIGSGAAYATLINCTVVSNWSSSATVQTRHTNSILYHNASGNYSGGTFSFSCTTPLPAGTGNISTVPQLFADAVHLQSTSPCRNTGANLSVGTDIDGHTWANPPSIGCDEWGGKPIIISQPRLQLTNNPIGYAISVTAAGEDPLAYYWFHNGFPIDNDDHFSQASSLQLVATGVGEWSAGGYHVVLSNSFGVVTSAVAQLTARFVNVSNNTPAAPYTSWANAATNIQDAIDTASADELVLVTNGIYRTGGKVMAGDLTNRVAINKAIIVQSINGPEATIVEGNWNPTVTNGPAAVRCAWLTNGAGLSGFTLRGGATRANAGDGGGVYGSSTNATVVNCMITSNTAFSSGGGAYRVSLVNCALTGNRAVGSGIPGVGAGGAGVGGGAMGCSLRGCIIQGNYAEQGNGGGVNSCNLINCALMGNSSYMNGGAAYAGKLVNCTVTGNTSSGYSSGYGAAVHSAAATNSVIWGNFSRTSYPNTNYASSTLAYCLSSPMSAGVGNLAVDPQLLSDGMHIAETSPCRAAGINTVVGADIDGQAWANPPAIGCDEWLALPIIAFPPAYQVGIPSRSLTFEVAVAGQSPTHYWFRNGAPLENDAHHTNTSAANLKVLKFGPEHAGEYYLVASNSFGIATSQVAKVVIHCVDAAGGDPLIPYSTWATAATSIQTAIDAAQADGIVLVTNGVYATGGKIVSGDLLNRVAIDKPLTVMSVNGYRNTVIEGVWDTVSTNGPAAVRCVAMVDGATLAGFTIKNGATRTNGDTAALQSGGGVWSPTFHGGASVANCLFTNNASGYLGGGIYGGAVKNSIFVENRGNIAGNAGGGGGAAAYSDLRNCTVNYNVCPFPAQGAGVYACRVYNSIVRGNYQGDPFGFENNYSPGFNPTFFAYSASFPLPSGVSNTTIWPVFLDWDYHLPAASPARGLGSSLYSSGEDFDGEAWASPPSIGADEVVEANLVGPISLSVHAWQTNTLVGYYHAFGLWASITGRVSRIDWNFGDGVIITNVGYTSPFHSWANAGTFTVTCMAYNTDNPGGVSASINIQVLPLVSPTIQAVSLDSSGFKFAFEAQETARYTVQYATNLAAPVTWSTLQDIYYSPGGTTQITDPAWTNAARFYRVLVQ